MPYYRFISWLDIRGTNMPMENWNIFPFLDSECPAHPTGFGSEAKTWRDIPIVEAGFLWKADQRFHRHRAKSVGPAPGWSSSLVRVRQSQYGPCGKSPPDLYVFGLGTGPMDLRFATLIPWLGRNIGTRFCNDISGYLSRSSRDCRILLSFLVVILTRILVYTRTNLEYPVYSARE